jgi:hypothetical protein
MAGHLLSSRRQEVPTSCRPDDSGGQPCRQAACPGGGLGGVCRFWGRVVGSRGREVGEGLLRVLREAEAAAAAISARQEPSAARIEQLDGVASSR